VKKSTRDLQEAMDDSRAELSTYRDILEITDRVKKADVKKEKRDPPRGVSSRRQLIPRPLEGRIHLIKKNPES